MSTTILIIDDNADVCENISEILGLAGYSTLMAADGKEGLELAKKHRPDLILCDIMMPRLDGYGVLQAVENIRELVDTPFVFLTAKSDKEDIRKGMDLGADDYLTKPFSGEELLSIVSARLRKKSLLKQRSEGTSPELEAVFSSPGEGQPISFNSDRTQTKKFRKKETIFLEGDSATFLYYVNSGSVKVFKSNEGGKEYITDILKAGDFFGHIALLEGRGHTESAVAIEDSSVGMIPARDFFELLCSDKVTSLKLIRALTKSLAEAEDKLLKLAYNSARKRVAEALMLVSKKFHPGGRDQHYFSFNRENISALAGISPESVSRHLTDFKEEGLIDANNGAIKILDLGKLENLKN